MLRKTEGEKARIVEAARIGHFRDGQSPTCRVFQHAPDAAEPYASQLPPDAGACRSEQGVKITQRNPMARGYKRGRQVGVGVIVHQRTPDLMEQAATVRCFPGPDTLAHQRKAASQLVAQQMAGDGPPVFHCPGNAIEEPFDRGRPA